ncbi:MAG: hypothetical protein JRN10_00215 [Nitrososphaerota archaeon]|jgi:hypothetical protein|nr:hypothetical protein [Nitrososphaerota archaeon]MDG6929661.1 hypothetical protein [Nitrososphaerota archaeon]
MSADRSKIKQGKKVKKSSGLKGKVVEKIKGAHVSMSLIAVTRLDNTETGEITEFGPGTPQYETAKKQVEEDEKRINEALAHGATLIVEDLSCVSKVEAVRLGNEQNN